MMEQELREFFVIVSRVNYDSKFGKLENVEFASSLFEKEPTNDNIKKEMLRLQSLGYRVTYSKIEKRYFLV